MCRISVGNVTTIKSAGVVGGVKCRKCDSPAQNYFFEIRWPAWEELLQNYPLNLSQPEPTVVCFSWAHLGWAAEAIEGLYWKKQELNKVGNRTVI